MSKVQMLRCLVNQRLTAAAEEIFGMFERTIAECEEELSRSKEENELQQRRLRAALTPQLRLHRADVQQLLVVKEEVLPEQHESSLDQEDPEPPHIKEELWTSQEGEQLQGLEETDVKFSFTPVRTEDDEEEAQSSQLHQRQTEQMETDADGEDCGGPEPGRNSDPDRHPEPDTDEKTGDSSDTDDSDDWKETRPRSIADVQQLLVVQGEVLPEQQEWSSSLDQEDPEPPHIKEELWTSQEGEQLQGLEETDVKFSFTPVKSEDDDEEAQSSQLHQRQTEQMETDADGEDCGGPEPGRNSSDTDDSDDCKETREPDEVHVSDSRCSAGEKLFTCSECEKTTGRKADLKKHMRTHTGEKPFSCSVCKNSFNRHSTLQTHMRTHTGEKPFSCSVCKNSFNQSSTLQRHMRTHTGEKPFSCSVCKNSFNRHSTLQRHMRTHTGEKPFSCSVCENSFNQSSNLQRHMRTHTGEKPFSCSVCENSFNQSSTLQTHMRTHTGEKPFSCSVCDERFWRKSALKLHIITHT